MGSLNFRGFNTLSVCQSLSLSLSLYIYIYIYIYTKNYGKLIDFAKIKYLHFKATNLPHSSRDELKNMVYIITHIYIYTYIYIYIHIYIYIERERERVRERERERISLVKIENIIFVNNRFLICTHSCILV